MRGGPAGGILDRCEATRTCPKIIEHFGSAEVWALKLTPDSYEALNKLGDAYYYAGNYYKALESYKRAVAQRPSEAEGYYNLALAYVEIGDRPAALAQARTLKGLDAELYRKLSAEMER